jgi:FtsP/CotA-like multicopper oxidase with cupredoxin domain
LDGSATKILLGPSSGIPAREAARPDGRLVRYDRRPDRQHVSILIGDQPQDLPRRGARVAVALATKALRLLGPRVPPLPQEAGWKDTVQAPPAVPTRIIARFEGYAGRYVWHCHVLEHAANEMMRPFEVVSRARR